MEQFRIGRGHSQFLSGLEDKADDVLRQVRHVLPHVARLFLISTFIEDSIRMGCQWSDQVEFMQDSWSCGWFLGSLFVAYNFFGQFIPVIMVMLRKNVSVAVGILASVLFLQTIFYHILWDMKFLARNVAVAGGLILLLAETQQEHRSLFAGIPRMGDSNKPKTYMLLVGRVLLALMFLSLVRFEWSLIYIIQLFFEFTLIGCVTFGFQTKISAMALSVWLFIINLWIHCWWNIPVEIFAHDYTKYDFFQTLSVIGGLLFVIAYGPGGVSIDDYKKRW